VRWDNDLLHALADAAGVSPISLRYAVARLMRELYYGEPETRPRDPRFARPQISRDHRGRPTPTLKQLAEVILR